MQTVRQVEKADVAPIFIPPEVDYTEVAERILQDTELLALRQQEFSVFMRHVERTLMEIDDEEILLMVA